MKIMEKAILEVQGARLGFRLAFETTFSDPPYQTVRLVPEFPHVRPDIAETTDIVWDLPQLCESIQRPGGYDVLNCTCGLGDHADLMELAFVAHPDDATVVWEIDIPGHRPALEARWRETEGFLRLVFRREDYEADIRAMLAAVLSAGSPDLPVEEYDPNRGGEVYELLQARAADGDWSRQPILRPGTLLEFRVARSSFLLLDGKPSNMYAPRLFTRWSAMAAFDHWADPFLLDRDLAESRGADCDEAGEAFAAVLRRCFAEGLAAPGVAVEYRPCREPRAAP